jgi:hypothetical protein
MDLYVVMRQIWSGGEGKPPEIKVICVARNLVAAEKLIHTLSMAADPNGAKVEFGLVKTELYPPLERLST